MPQITKFMLPKSRLTHLIFILLITLATIIAWHGILNQIIEGEGYYYFSPTNSFVIPPGTIAFDITRFDNFPRASTYLLENVFEGNIQPYMNFQFIIIIFLNISIYLTLFGITKNKALAFLGAIYFGLNYSGDYQLYARGHFQWFTQRVVEFLPMLGAIFFIWQYTNTKLLKNYLVSYAFFLIALIMTHYTILFLPFFPSFLLVSATLLHLKFRQRLKIILLSLPFIITTYLIVGNSTLGLDIIHPNQSLLESIWQTTDTLHKISFQLVVVTFPYSLLNLLSHITKLPNIQLVNWLILPIFIGYMAAGIYLYKNRLSYYNLLLGCFLALIGVLYINVYVNRVIIFNEIEQGRYLFIPGLYVGIIYASLICSFLNKVKAPLLSKFIFISLLLLWAVPNTFFIWNKINSSQRYFTAGRAMLTYLEQAKTNLPKDAYIMLPNPLMPLGIDFLKKYYNPGTATFLYNDINWKSKIYPSDVNKLYVFDYNEEYYRGSQARAQYISVVDKSSIYREALKQEKSLRF